MKRREKQEKVEEEKGKGEEKRRRSYTCVWQRGGSVAVSERWTKVE